MKAYQQMRSLYYPFQCTWKIEHIIIGFHANDASFSHVWTSYSNAMIDLKNRNELFIEGVINWTATMLSLVLAVAELPHLVFHPDTPTGGLWCPAPETKLMWNIKRGAEPPVHLRPGWLAGTPIPPLSDAPSIMLPTILHRPPQLPSILCPGRVLVHSYSNL